MIKFISRCSTIGKLMVIIGFSLLFPIVVLPFYSDEINYISSFLLPALSSILIGIIVCLILKKHTDERVDEHTNLRRSSLTVLFAWFWAIVCGALPFVLSKQLNFIQALFESVSGWTTTGLSVVDVTVAPKIFLFHRSFMQFCGGLGLILMMIVLVSSKNSMDLYNAEGHPDKIMPNIKKTARAIFIIYSVCLFIGVFAYLIAGMPLFDAICHTMCTLSTGGFSTKLNSFGDYNSLAIEIITIVLMLIGTTNFVAILLLAKGNFKKFAKISEIRFMWILMLIFIPITAISLMNWFDISFFESLRMSVFNVPSALSTTGYSTMSYSLWPPFAIVILIVLMLIGGGFGSTAGGIKLTRIYLMIRVSFANVKKRIYSRNKVERLYYNNAQGRQEINSDLVNETFSFIFIYMLIYIAGVLTIMASANCTLMEAMFEFASSLSTVGLSIGITSPTASSLTLITEMIGMLLGRLEIFIVFVGLFTGLGWIKNLFRKTAKKS